MKVTLRLSAKAESASVGSGENWKINFNLVGRDLNGGIVFYNIRNIPVLVYQLYTKFWFTLVDCFTCPYVVRCLHVGIFGVLFA